MTVSSQADLVGALPQASPLRTPGLPHRLARLRLPRNPLSAAWLRLSLRAQLLLVFVLIDLAAVLVAGSVMIVRARTSTRIEISASMSLAEALVAETIRLTPANAVGEVFPLQRRFMRHVRISVRNAADLPVAIGGPVDRDPAPADSERPPAPAWFTALIAPPVERRTLPVIVNGQRIGSILITGEPSDEIAEAWENVVALASAGTALNVAVIALLFLLFGRVLGPLSALAQGLQDLEQRNYRVRLARPGARELAAITERFNALAEALDTARAENSRLNHRLITAQDDERRRTALDLHDEVGPCLFGLKATATSMAKMASDLPGPTGTNVRERADEMLGILDHLQTINRSLLNRLRPMALGHVPLGDILSEVVRERARQYPRPAFSFSPGVLRPSYGDSIDLTIYRCVQEGLTNAIRHAEAKNVAVSLGEEPGPDGASSLILIIRDDGLGIASAAPKGLGLSGMQERVEALGGAFRIDTALRQGTSLRIAIPLPPSQPNDAADNTERVA